MLTNEHLEAEVERIMELDQKRTQGEWDLEIRDGASLLPCGQIFAKGKLNYHIPKISHFSINGGKDNANFIASAPQMAQIIRQLWEERQNSIPIAKLDGMVGKVESLKQARNYKSKENNLRYENMINYGIGEWNKAIEAAINAIKQEAGK